MQKYIHIGIKVVYSLLLLLPVSGILSLLGFAPGPEREFYNTDVAYQFVDILYTSVYGTLMVITVSALALVLVWMKREALSAILMLPIMVNVIGFHWFLDGGLFTLGSIPGNLLFLIVLYLMWQNRQRYYPLLNKS